MKKDKGGRYSGIGGQAVLEGVMMKNKEQYAVAVRKPDGEIDVEVDVYRGVMDDSVLKKVPFIRGIFNFLDSMILGMRTLNHSVSFYEDEEAKETAADKVFNKVFKEKAENVMLGIVTVISILLAIAIFMVLPYFITSLFEGYIRNVSFYGDDRRADKDSYFYWLYCGDYDDEGYQTALSISWGPSINVSIASKRGGR